MYKVANNLNASQQTFLQKFLEQNLSMLMPTIFIKINETIIQPDKNGYYEVSIRVDLLKDCDIGFIKLLVFDGITENFSNPQIEEYDARDGSITFKVKGNFAIAFFQSEE